MKNKVHKKRQHMFNEKQKESILKNYEYGDLKKLCIEIGASRGGIHGWATKNGLKRKIKTNQNCNLSVLLNKSLQSYYWLGFLAADGYVSMSGNVVASQVEKDKEVIYNFSKYIGSNVRIQKETSSRPKNYITSGMDVNYGKKIRDIWGLKNEDKKTYSSISFDFIENKDQAQAFFIGFFDGDGCLPKNDRMGIVSLHKNWLPFFEKLIKLCSINSILKIDKKGFLRFSVSVKCMRTLKRFINENKLIHNSRKWNFPEISKKAEKNEETSSSFREYIRKVVLPSGSITYKVDVSNKRRRLMYQSLNKEKAIIRRNEFLSSFGLPIPD